MAQTVFSLVGRIALQGMESVNRDISEAEKKVKAFQRELGKLGASISRAGASLTKNLTAPMMGVTAAIGVLALKTGEYASKLLSMSEATGLSTDTLQEFEHVARAAGVSSDALLSVTQKLTGKLDDIQAGTGDAALAMDRLGISVTNADGSMRTMEEIFPEVLGELNKIENSTERNNVASKLFGRNMNDLAPVLAMTADELAAVRKEAHDTGKVMGKDALTNADDFRKSVANLKAEMGVLSMQIASSFIPILQGQVVPLIQDKVVPVVVGMANALKGLAEWFGNLSPAVQNTVLVFGAFVAIAGPALLMTGKLILAMKSMIGTVATLGGALKGLWAVMIANPIGLVVTAFAAFAATVMYSRKKIKELDEEIANLEAHNARTKAFQDQHKVIKGLIDEYEKLRGTDAFDPAEMERLNKALDDNAIALSNHWRAFNKQAPLNELEQENRRRSIRGIKELTAAEWEAEKHRTVITDRQRKLREDEKAEEARLAEERRKINEQRKADLASLVAAHMDAIDKISMTELQLLDREEQRALAEATRLRANQQELETIRLHFSLRREKMLFDEEQALRDAADEAEKRIAEEEAEKLRIREDANAQWERKLLTQTGDRLAILDAEYADALTAAEKAGADQFAVMEYYATERYKLMKEMQDEEIRIAKTAADEVASAWERQARTISDSFIGAVNKLGSVMSMFSRNEEQRLSKEYKQRREYINANVEDEKERAKQLTALDEEEEARKLEIQRRQAKRDKALGIFNTVVDTARAIVKSLAELGPIAGPIMAGVVGALGIAQTAAIAAQPEPFYAGGLIMGSQDGITAQVGEGNQDEVVLPLERGTEQIADRLLDAIHGQNEALSSPREYHAHYHIGALIADESGLRKLERNLRPYRVAEDRRTGAQT